MTPLPHNEDAEIGILGACLLDPKHYDDLIADGFTPDHLHKPVHRLMFWIMGQVREKYGTVDEVSCLQHTGETPIRGSIAQDDTRPDRWDQPLVTILPATEWSKITARIERVGNFNTWKQIVQSHAIARQLARRFSDLHQSICAKPSDAATIVEETASWLTTLTTQSHDAKTLLSAEELSAKTLDRIEKERRREIIPGIGWGLTDIDRLCLMRPGQMVVLAARPSMGKSALALNTAYRVAKSGTPVLWFGLEMPNEESMIRLIAAHGSINIKAYTDGRSHQTEHQVHRAAAEAGRLPIWFEEQTPINIARIRNTARRYRLEKQIGLVVIDYLQLADANNLRLPREQQISEISRGCKHMAKELSLPVLALAQVNREVDKRTKPALKLSDLRECLPVDHWVSTPTGPVKIGERPTEVCSHNPLGPVRKHADFVEKRYNSLYELSTAFGTLRATAKHMVLTGTGWKQMAKIDPCRDVIACPTEIESEVREYLPHGKLLGWLLGNGHLKGTPTLIVRPHLVAAVDEAIKPFGIKAFRLRQKTPECVPLSLSAGLETGSIPNPLTVFLRELGMWGALAWEKSIPQSYLVADPRTRAELLRGLFETDGCVSCGQARYDTTSEALAHQTKWLLHTLGIRSRVSNSPAKGNAREIFRVAVQIESNEILKAYGICSDPQRFGRLKDPSPRYIDPAPLCIAEYCYDLYRAERTKIRVQRNPDGTVKRIGKAVALRIMQENNPFIHLPFFAYDKIGWARVTSLKKLDGDHRVCDLQVPGTNCFVADGILAHNSGSIEQDADIVCFIQPTEKDPESDKYVAKGKMVFDIAKQRNGPTGSTCLTYIPQFSRFDNFAHQYQ
jgi:replicative DNA helicase